MEAFSDPAAVARYAEGPPRLVPGFADLQRMALLLLAESAGESSRILVLGSGGGLELKVFAEAKPHWTFVGIDPSAEMNRLALATLGPLASRIELRDGYIDAAPEGPYDGATCLLTMHFMPREERRKTLSEIHRRLKPGAPLVVAHHSIPAGLHERDRWLSRYAAFAASSGIDPDKAAAGSAAIGSKLPILSPEEDVELLGESGFDGISLFYAGLTFRGWVAYRR
ncbi:MAG: class I SAM-dependent methyltransferase [Acidobacteria bacterium]|nr:class I SAM-dependent methyltransferase [Acidobacteriota bacterium]MBI3489860.1 class I SAM-dependent methyltransferase [Acidobacteriota bacterium]